VRNLWRGFAFTPRRGDCSLYLAHLRDNVCAKDPAKYRYLVGWMAYAVRHPDENGYAAVAVKGKKGVGKNVFAEAFGRLWGQHSLLVSDQSRITSNFNAHLRDKCVLIADEAFFAGDKRHEGILKHLITGETLSIEAKGVDPAKSPNLLHIIMLSNERWVVPATEDERRYFFVQCGGAQRGNFEYFKALQSQLDRGGYEALLWHLMEEVDLSGFEVRDPPTTRELVEQMYESLRGIEAAWFECLQNGQVPGRVMDNGSVELRAGDFLLWAAAQKGRRWDNLKSLHVGQLAGEFGFGRVQATLAGRRKRFWTIPTLERCREKWDDMKSKFAWPDDGGEWDSVTGIEYDF
jgi:hypothetical protein